MGDRAAATRSSILKRNPAARECHFKSDSRQPILVIIKQGAPHNRQRHVNGEAWLIQGALESGFRVWRKRPCTTGGAGGRHGDCL
jgi:hypothetical protein